MTGPRKILVSACLLGERVRWDGTGAEDVGRCLRRWEAEERLVVVCPEVSGGLPVPRPPAEGQEDGRVVTVDGDDVTAAFERGGARAVELARRHDVAFAVMKARSPSCGSLNVYDGSFSGTLKPGEGVAARALADAGFEVFSEERLDEAVDLLATLETC